MKILIIDNNTYHLPSIQETLADHEVEIRKYQPGADLSCDDKDLVILTGGGGDGLEIHDEHESGKLWYEDEMKFIRQCQKPLLGICMGFEVISKAFGAEIVEMTTKVNGNLKIELTKAGQQYFGKKSLKQFEWHDWCVPEAPKDFEVLAKSKTGIEIIKHKTRPILATQFHPEVPDGTLGLNWFIEKVYAK